jgi:GT2 family glycosyltransferase
VVAENWIERIVEVLSSSHASAVGGRIEKYKPETLVQRHGITLVDGQRTLNYLPALHLPYVVSANVGYDREQLVAMGGFNERLLSGSDVDICYRLGLTGHTIDLAPDAVVYHDDRRTVGDHFQRFAHYAQYQVLLFALYRPISGKRMVINPYPWRRAAGALVRLPSALFDLIIGRPSSALEALLQLVEAAGVWWGDLRGSLKYRQMYL